MTYVASFVKPAAEVAGQQQFTVVAPPSNYSWTTVATEPPSSQLLKMTVTANWAFGGEQKSFDLTTLIGPRQASDEALRGAAKIEYVMQARTGYVDEPDAHELPHGYGRNARIPCRRARDRRIGSVDAAPAS